jgi:hypothetical protein
LNFIGFIFLFPETRWNRSINGAATKSAAPAAQNAPTRTEKDGHIETIEQARTHEDVELTGTRKTFMQELKPWSGTASQSWFLHFVRPLPLIAYPAVAWGAFACIFCPPPLETFADESP